MRIGESFLTCGHAYQSAERYGGGAMLFAFRGPILSTRGPESIDGARHSQLTRVSCLAVAKQKPARDRGRWWDSASFKGPLAPPRT